MEIAITSLCFIIFCFFISRLPFFQLEGIGKKWTIAAFSLKFLCGIMLWAIYTYHYTDRSAADIYKYFDDAKIIHQKLDGRFPLAFQIISGMVWQESETMEILKHTNHWFRSFDYIQINDNRIIIRLNLLLLYLSNGVFHVHTLVFTFLSFIGATALFRFFSNFEKRKMVLFLCSFLIPSVLFWTSGVLKESWLFFLLGLFVWQFSKTLDQPKVKSMLSLLIIMFALLLIKPFILVLIVPALLYLSLSKAWNASKEWMPFLITHLGLIIIFTAFVLITNNQKIFELMQAQQNAFYEIAKEVGGVSTISISDVSSLKNAALASPKAVFNALFRPLAWESKNVLQVFSSLENLLFLIIIFFIPFFYKKPDKRSTQLMFFSLSFVLSLSLLIGWTTPVLGTIVRYKVPLLPFFAILLFQFIRINEMDKTFTK